MKGCDERFLPGMGINTTKKGGHTNVHIEEHLTSSHVQKELHRDSVEIVSSLP